MFIIGNQPRFETSVYKGVRIILLPEFCKTREFVLLDVASKDCRLVSVKVEEGISE